MALEHTYTSPEVVYWRYHAAYAYHVGCPGRVTYTIDGGGRFYPVVGYIKGRFCLREIYSRTVSCAECGKEGPGEEFAIEAGYSKQEVAG